jgi:hypothetical protein
MASIPDDMLYYYHTMDGETLYFSTNYRPKLQVTQIVEIEEDDFWSIVKEGKLTQEEIYPDVFKYPIPGNISGTVKAFVIK